MKWPSLVKPWACKVPVAVRLEGPLGEDGAPVAGQEIVTKCSYSEKQRQVLDAQRRMVQLQGTVFFSGDLAPGVAALTGTVEVQGGSWNIFRAERARNPDGTVNYTKLELM